MRVFVLVAVIAALTEGCGGTSGYSAEDNTRNNTSALVGAPSLPGLWFDWRPYGYNVGEFTFATDFAIDGELSVDYGAGSYIPVVGRWDGGLYTLGVFNPSNRAWELRNSNSGGNPDITFVYGGTGDIPVVGDWDGNGTTTIGIFRPSTREWKLRNSNSAGSPDITTFVYGGTGDTPVVGDWDGNGTDTIGIYRPSTGEWKLRNSNSGGNPDIQTTWGGGGEIPITGAWQF